MIFPNKADFTSEPIPSPFVWSYRVYLRGDFGTGTVELQIKSEDGTWHAYPETTFDKPTAHRLELHTEAELRVVVKGCTDVTVEVRT